MRSSEGGAHIRFDNPSSRSRMDVQLDSPLRGSDGIPRLSASDDPTYLFGDLMGGGDGSSSALSLRIASTAILGAVDDLPDFAREDAYNMLSDSGVWGGGEGLDPFEEDSYSSTQGATPTPVDSRPLYTIVSYMYWAATSEPQHFVALWVAPGVLLNLLKHFSFAEVGSLAHNLFLNDLSVNIVCLSICLSHRSIDGTDKITCYYERWRRSSLPMSTSARFSLLLQ